MDHLLVKMQEFVSKPSVLWMAICFMLFYSSPSQSQNITISGYITDNSTGEKLIGANVYLPISQKGVSSNGYGFFSFTIPATDSISIQVSYIGYLTKKFNISATNDLLVDLDLSPGQNLSEIEITESKVQSIQFRNEMGVISIPVQQMKTLPAIGGEPDLMKVLQLTPGVKGGNEGSSGLYIRGGSPDQNLILLDDVPLYYVNHLGGFVSLFNADALNDFKLIKGGFPAHYGSRLSSILDIKMKEGNMQKFKCSGMIGMVASKVSIEGPIFKDKTSYIISFRRFLYDLITRPLSKVVFEGLGMGYNFYDLNAKINHQINKNNHIFFSLYSGDDKILVTLKDDSENQISRISNRIKWGNNLIAFRWNHLFSYKLFSNTTLTYTRYRYITSYLAQNEFDNKKTKSESIFESGIYDVNSKIDFEYYHNTNYKLKFGYNTIYHSFKPGVTIQKQTDNSISLADTSYGSYNLNSIENALYVENELNMFDKLSLNIGARATSYHVNGKNYFSIEPRILINRLLNKDVSIKASYSFMQQYIHLLTSAGAGMPTDLWMPATDMVKPSKSHQISIGLAKTIANGLYELSIESYYKKMKNLIAYKEGVSFLNSGMDWQQKVEKNGIGSSFGLELFMQKKEGRYTGWVGYTLSKTDRQFSNINNGKAFPFIYDRRHDFSVVFNYKLKERIHFSSTWVYGTGNAITLAVGKYNLITNPSNDGETYDTEIHIYEGKNSFRMGAYHRLDIGFNFLKDKKRGKRIWSVSIYNAYNHKNPYYYYYTSTYSYDNNGYIIPGTGKTVLKQQSYFPIIPSVSYSFVFR